MNKLKYIQPVNDSQIKLGKKLGLNLKGLSKNVAFANILHTIKCEFNLNDNTQTTEKQIKFAKVFGFNIENMPKSIGSAYLEDICESLDQESIINQKLKPGDTVMKKNDPLKTKYIISSFQADGFVYFKGGQGKKAYPHTLIKA